MSYKEIIINDLIIELLPENQDSSSFLIMFSARFRLFGTYVSNKLTASGANSETRVNSSFCEFWFAAHKLELAQTRYFNNYLLGQSGHIINSGLAIVKV